MLCQTPERHWEVGDVSRLPWPDELSDVERIAAKAERIAGAILRLRTYDLTSPHYRAPALLGGLTDGWVPESHADHPHRALSREVDVPERADEAAEATPLEELAISYERHERRLRQRIEDASSDIERAIHRALGLGDSEREEIYSEVTLRTNETPRNRDEYAPDAIAEPGDDFPQQVKDLLLHFTLRAVHESDDGIVPLSDVEGEDDLLTHVEAEFERIWGEHATDRLAEVDDLLGNESAATEPYPNLRRWLEDDLFDYHVQKFDRTPILWQFTTERLVSDPEGEGFGCFVDYHRLDQNVFDRLRNRYLEPRNARLFERRSAADRRRSDDALSASERAAAAEAYARCESGLEQIAAFEDRLVELAQPAPREWSTEDRRIAAAAAERVAEFRERTEERLDIVDELAAMEDVDMGTLFAGNFYGKVEEQRGEWVDALDDLEAAFDAYAADPDQPVEAHLYDLFDYYADDLLGSSHFASNGILYMTYYFDEFERADQSRLDDGGVSRRRRLVSRLASELDEYVELGESISRDCKAVSSGISADWSDRALSEITTAGYEPNHKHGVAINITPLAEAELVPTTVDDDVL